MKNLGLHEIRRKFLDFFEEKEHLVHKSYPLVPKKDKSLLLINAGMAPLKPYFLGKETPPNKRMATSQKCIRTGDIENVGKTARHGTFFEMLGNFSFGDYFKEESIIWAWEFLIDVLDMPKEELWVSIYLDDDESFAIWNEKVGVPKERIVRLGKEDNFWELEIGPCGPCSEIYVDRGPKYKCDNPDCKPGCDCDRYMEIWNLVFSQYDKDKDGNYNLLDKPNIDTGMGLERIATILQEKDNIFEINVMNDIIYSIEKRSGKEYASNRDNEIGMSFRVISDHIKAMTFLIGDGVLPSNEGRGYVLRRLIRRAARHANKLGIEGNFLNDLSLKVVDIWGVEYDELHEDKDRIKSIVQAEEEKFQETIEQGIEILEEYIDDMSKKEEKTLNGEKAFKLYDTYGFPIDLTEEILLERGYSVDEEKFKEEMEKQRSRARKARDSGDFAGWDAEINIEIASGESCEFVRLKDLEINSKVIGIYNKDGETPMLTTGESGIVILDKTPFYPEGGGQVGDTGELTSENIEAKVVDTQRENENIIVHKVELINGKIELGETLTAKVDKRARKNIARNHTVTHLVHQALKDTLGEHVNQAGSLVMGERMRFDFTHFEAVKKSELEKIEDIVNEKILDGLEIEIIETTIDEARNMGAQALFDEKYDEIVRVIKIGNYSMELCGGTHVYNTSEIGGFKIIFENGIAAGVRRIEVVTGMENYKYSKEQYKIIDNITEILRTNKKDLLIRTGILVENLRKTERELNELKNQLAVSSTDDIIGDIKEISGISYISRELDSLDADELRKIGDNIKSKMESGVIVLSSVKDGKIAFVAMATKDLVKKGIHAGNILREIAKVTGGGGGGRPDMAQAGGKDASKLSEAMDLVRNIIINKID